MTEEFNGLLSDPPPSLKENPLKFQMEPPGIKYDEGKLDWTLLPWAELREIVKVLDYGAKKYMPDNWMYVKDGIHRYQAAFFRHMVAYLSGEKLDTESGLPHLAHAGCCLLFLMWFEANKPEVTNGKE